MKLSITLDILFDLLSKRKLTANEIAEKHTLSPRTVYRYIAVLKEFVPVRIKRGRNGGICLADNYKLPMGFLTQAEYEATIDALLLAYASSTEERFLSAKRKLSIQKKEELREYRYTEESGTVVIDSRYGGDMRSFLQKLRILDECIREKRIVETQQRLSSGEITQEKIEPHAMLLRDNVWYVYGFCHKNRTFTLFALGNLFSLLKTEERFRKRPFHREELFLPPTNIDNTLSARFEISAEALSRAQEWLGVEHIRKQKSTWIAEVTLPNDDVTVERIVSFGAGLKVLSPISLQQRVVTFAKGIIDRY